MAQSCCANFVIGVENVQKLHDADPQVGAL
jgi:hypothetical protein